jgi:hypothetical protein
VDAKITGKQSLYRRNNVVATIYIYKPPHFAIVLKKLHNGLIFAVSALLIYLLFVNIPSYVEAQSQRWYAGYFDAGTPISAPWGVSGKIYTINPQVPALTTMFQWVTVILSYVNDYWLQVVTTRPIACFTQPTSLTIGNAYPKEAPTLIDIFRVTLALRQVAGTHTQSSTPSPLSFQSDGY